MTFQDILDELRREASSNRDMGGKFERLIAGYLKTDPLYRDRFEDVWLWSDWPGRDKRPDAGIDLVAKERAGDGFCAIQCKFYASDHSLQKADIDSFFTASGKDPFTSRLIVSTTDLWSSNAEEALRGQKIPVTRLRVQDLASSAVDWSAFSFSKPESVKLRARKELRPHQKAAVESVVAGFMKSDRGKLIMACGTGKTFTALKLAEELVPAGGRVLFLVPSISLVSQSLREWTAESRRPLSCFVVCSDPKAVKRAESEDIAAHDLAFPATTDAKKLAEQVRRHGDKKGLVAVFSTYQSIKVVAEAQKLGLPAFDLAVCDEAHRTTGATLEGEDESHFVRVHDADWLKVKKRLYMTATPRIYGDEAKTKAREGGAVLASMDDEKLYGPEFHRLGFSEAVKHGLLADYKVMVLAVDEKFVSRTFQAQLADKNSELGLDDAAKIIGCWNALQNGDGAPMRRAVAFCRSIRDSKRIRDLFAGVVAEYRRLRDAGATLDCELDHVDGTFNALERNRRLDWLKADSAACRILSNARCLSEGVDVPALDAVMFLNPRNSVVDVVQSVGRVMRLARGKKYGYIILPVPIPADMPPEQALRDNKRYQVVWQVLQALRAHDDRFNATINKIELTSSRPDQIQIIGIGGSAGEDSQARDAAAQLALEFPHIEEWRNAIYAKVVEKCGDRRYWESWAADVARIAERHVARLKSLVDNPRARRRAAFEEFLAGLRANINPSIDENAAVEMLSQHLITRPVFDALFAGSAFTRANPVSAAMQKMIDLLEDQSLEKETASLAKFYESVQERAQGIDTAEGRQRIIVELYDKFFRLAFPRMADRLGIVYTPVEVVDYIVRSADAALRAELGASLSDKDVHVLDPFTGTGTFMVRLLQGGLIAPEDLARKYKSELHANEIVLLAYYIAAINIEEAYHGAARGNYAPFPGIVLTDTFQMAEAHGSARMFPENNARAERQSGQKITVILGNPPYSAGQTSENDANQNLDYPSLDARIRDTYAAKSSAGLKKNLYDSYVRSIRWASDRIADRGVIAFVTNNSFIDGNAMDGLRACLQEEFSSIYVFNLRGHARTSGEDRRKEKGNVFGEGTRTGVAVTILVKNPASKSRGVIRYHDIGDYLTRDEKLKAVAGFGDIRHTPWTELKPNSDHDWINQRDPAFAAFLPLGDKAGEEKRAPIFARYSQGVLTARDAWAYNFSRRDLAGNMRAMIEFYNSQVGAYQKAAKTKIVSVENFIDNDPKKISWTFNLKGDLAKGRAHNYESQDSVPSMYRPFCKQWLYFNRRFNERVYLMPSLFPDPEHGNLVISLSGVGATKGFAALIMDSPANYHALDTAQCFPLYYYEEPAELGELFEGAKSAGLVRRDAITDSALADFQSAYDKTLTKEDVFYYVYGILHSPEYKRRFESDLKKSMPRIPLAGDFWAFSKAGRALARLHLNYETVEPWPLREESSGKLGPRDLRVEKMRFAKNGKDEDRSTLIYNSRLTLRGIPAEADEYVVNGKPAVDWIVDRYQVSTDPDSGILNDPNKWSDDPRYIVDLFKRVARVSVESARIVRGLPPLHERADSGLARLPATSTRGS